MKKLAVIIVAVVATACVVAQERPNRGPNGRGGAGGDRPHAGERPHPGMGPNAGMWVPRMFSSKAALERIGVTDEAQRTKIQDDVIYARYNTEIGRGNQIPLWLLGFLY